MILLYPTTKLENKIHLSKLLQFHIESSLIAFADRYYRDMIPISKMTIKKQEENLKFKLTRIAILTR